MFKKKYPLMRNMACKQWTQMWFLALDIVLFNLHTSKFCVFPSLRFNLFIFDSILECNLCNTYLYEYQFNCIALRYRFNKMSRCIFYFRTFYLLLRQDQMKKTSQLFSAIDVRKIFENFFWLTFILWFK